MSLSVNKDRGLLGEGGIRMKFVSVTKRCDSFNYLSCIVSHDGEVIPLRIPKICTSNWSSK
jgi:hypothetical protein